MPEVISRRRVFGLLGVATLALAAPGVFYFLTPDSIGHFNRASKLVIGKPPPLVQVSVCRSSSALPKHPRTLFMASRRPQAYLT